MTIDVAFTHRFPGFSLDVAFRAPPGVTALFGRSGSGKTTVANVVAGLLRPDGGRVAVEDKALFDTASRYWLPPHKRRIGYVFQEGRLFPHLTVRKNLEFGGRFSGTFGQTADFDHVPELLGIENLLDRRPGNLSGGEKQRVAIGRALLSSPRLLVMDEPLASLDNTRKAEILPYLARLRDETKVPILYVSHSVAEVARLATTVVMLADGRVTDMGPSARVLSDPAVAPTLGVREAGAVIKAKVADHHPDGLTELIISGGRLFLPTIESASGAHINVRIHAQDIVLSREKPPALSALNVLEVVITALRQGSGPGVMVQLKCGNDVLLARLPRRAAEILDLTVGASCYGIVNAVAIAPDDVWTS